MAASDPQVPHICQLDVLPGAGLAGVWGPRVTLDHCGIGLALGEGRGCGAEPRAAPDHSSWGLPGAPRFISNAVEPQNFMSLEVPIALVRRWGQFAVLND